MREQIEIFKAETVETEHGIYGFFGKYRFLSNFQLCDINYAGLHFPSVENAYQAMKTNDLELRKQFTFISPSEAKKLGGAIEIRADWETWKLGVMNGCLLLKFTEIEGIKKLLLATGDKYLEETNYWNDQFWGVYKNEGKNYLGQMLMEIRGMIK